MAPIKERLANALAPSIWIHKRLGYDHLIGHTSGIALFREIRVVLGMNSNMDCWEPENAKYY